MYQCGTLIHVLLLPGPLDGKRLPLLLSTATATDAHIRRCEFIFVD
jgi:hypothetical protein